MNGHKQIYGDLLDLAAQGEFDVIIHGCNCFCTMGAGLAAQVAQRYPEAAAVDRETQRGAANKLGSFSSVTTRDGFVLVNAYTQYQGGANVDYDAIRRCFQRINEAFPDPKTRFGIPLIGAGIAGGDWGRICRDITTIMHNRDLTVVHWSRT